MEDQEKKPKRIRDVWIFLGLIIVVGLFAWVASKKGGSDHKEALRQDSIAAVKAQVADSLDQIRVDSARMEISEILSGLRKETDDMRNLSFYYDKSSPKYLNQNAVFCYLAENKGRYSVRMKVQYFSDDWLFINKYIFKADSALFNYPLIRRADGEVISGGIIEWIDVLVEDLEIKIMEAVSEGSECKVRYSGKEFHKDRVITSKEKAALKKFVRLYKLIQSVQEDKTVY